MPPLTQLLFTKPHLCRLSIPHSRGYFSLTATTRQQVPGSTPKRLPRYMMCGTRYL